MFLSAPLSGPGVWLFCWCAAGITTTVGHLSQLAQPGGTWPADSNSKLMSPSYIKRRLPLLLSFATLPLVHFVDHSDTTFRCVVAFASAFYVLKTRETILEDRFSVEPLWIKVAGVIGTFHDVQERVPAQPWVWPRVTQVLREAFKMLFHGMACGASVWVLHHRVDLAELISPAIFGLISVRRVTTALACVSACLYSFFSLHVYGDSLAVLWLLVGGFAMPSLMQEPERALSVKQFWLRWDVTIQKLLRRYVYQPLREVWGVPASVAISGTFLASGMVHCYPIIVALGSDWHAAASMMGYFVVQLGFIFMERPLGVEKWDSTNAFAWTLMALFVPSYILVSPVFKLLGMSGP
jgi:D-alanyl-lipoteichoic acid acyltransferase DltB (MBOAT superfamily)